MVDPSDLRLGRDLRRRVAAVLPGLLADQHLQVAAGLDLGVDGFVADDGKLCVILRLADFPGVQRGFQLAFLFLQAVLHGLVLQVDGRFLRGGLRLEQCLLLGDLAGRVDVQVAIVGQVLGHLGHIFLRLGGQAGQVAADPADRARSGIVGRNRLRHVAAELAQQVSQILRRAFDGLGRIIWIRHAQAFRRGRHELHQPLRAIVAHRAGVESAFSLGDGPQQPVRQGILRLVAVEKIVVGGLCATTIVVWRWRRRAAAFSRHII